MIPFALTIADIVIPKRCPVLGIEIRTHYERRTDHTPSLDRIRPEVGYVPDNVVVVSWRANRLKNNATLEELRALADFYCGRE